MTWEGFSDCLQHEAFVFALFIVCAILSKLWLWEGGFCNDVPPGEMPFPVISSFQESWGKGQQLEMEKKMEE